MGLGDLVRNPQLLLVTLIVLLTLFFGILTLLKPLRNSENHKITLGLALLFGIGLCSYFAPGDVGGGDSHSHIARTWLFSNILSEEHHFPIWSNRWYFGYPSELYYGFFYYQISALISFAFNNDVFLGTKITLWVCHVLSGFFMFLFIRMRTRSGICALFGAVFYVFSFQHIGLMLYSGYLTLSLIFLLTPIFFIYFELHNQHRLSTLSAAFSAALILFLMLITHVQYGLLASFGSLLAVFIYLLFDTKRRRDRTVFLLSTILIFSLLSLWFIVPFFTDSSNLVLSSWNSAEEIEDLSWNRLLQFNNFVLWSRVKNSWMYYYLGITTLVFAFIGLFSRNDDRLLKSCKVLFVFGVFMTFLIPRYVFLWFFFICVMSAYGILRFEEYLKNRPLRHQKFAYIFLAAAVTLDLGLAAVQTPFNKFSNLDIAEIQKEMTDRGELGRILVLSKNQNQTLWRSLDVIGTNASSAFGGIPQSATKNYPYVTAMAAKAAKEILDNEGSMSQETYDAFRLLNIKRVFVPSMSKTIKIAGAYPAWFSTRLIRNTTDTAVLDKQSWDSLRPKYDDRSLDYSITTAFTKKMKLDPSLPLAENIVLHSSYSQDVISKLNTTSDGESVSFEINNAKETHSSFDIEFKSSSPGYLHLSYSYFPFNRVEVDGQETKAYRSAEHFTVVQIPSGKHKLTITAHISKTRHILIYVALILAIVLSFVSIFKAYKTDVRN